MGLLGRALMFAARECARPCLEKIGEHVGDAIGTVIGKRIDPNHGKSDEDDPDEETEPEESDSEQGIRKTKGGGSRGTSPTHPHEG